jgi:poly-gamma-glutamate synthesis protein (capsule biosynthesis protein)
LVKHKSTVRLADTKKSHEILSALKERSMHILLPHFIEEEYRKFAASKLDDYMAAISGRNYLYRITKKIFKNKIIKRYSKKQLLAIQNYIQCEAHRELILNGLKSRYGRRNTY